VRDLGEEEAAAGRERRHKEAEPELLSPDRLPEQPERCGDACEAQRAGADERNCRRLAGHP
jgi:hypothetical protein